MQCYAGVCVYILCGGEGVYLCKNMPYDCVGSVYAFVVKIASCMTDTHLCSPSVTGSGKRSAGSSSSLVFWAASVLDKAVAPGAISNRQFFFFLAWIFSSSVYVCMRMAMHSCVYTDMYCIRAQLYSEKKHPFVITFLLHLDCSIHHITLFYRYG